MDKIFITFVLLTMVVLSVQRSCHDGKGNPYCDESKCPKKIKCKGNRGKDMCNCCDVCLKQEGEICGGQDNHLGVCDHPAPKCLKIGKNVFQTCTSLKTATQHGLLLKDRLECDRKPNWPGHKNFLKCFFKLRGPVYYCKKEIMYDDKDCCMHKDLCHPNEELYERVIQHDLDLSAIGTTYREEKKKRLKLTKKLTAASLNILKLKMQLQKFKLQAKIK